MRDYLHLSLHVIAVIQHALIASLKMTPVCPSVLSALLQVRGLHVHLG